MCEIKSIIIIINNDQKNELGTFFGLTKLTLENVRIGQKDDVYY